MNNSQSGERLQQVNRAFTAMAEDQLRATTEAEFSVYVDLLANLLEAHGAELKLRADGKPGAADFRHLNETDFCAQLQAIVLMIEACDLEKKRRLAGGVATSTHSIGRA